MAHVLFKKISNAARYAGQYLRSYLDQSNAYLVGGLADKYGIRDLPLEQVVASFAAGIVPNVGEVQNARKTEPDALGRVPLRALDAAVSVEKVVSVAFALLATHRDEIFAAIKQALANVLVLLEERCAVARAGRERSYIKGQWLSLVVPEFTSRNGDIQIHFHAIIFNAIVCIDGIVRALDPRPLFHHASWAGALMAAELGRLLREIGLEVSQSPQGNLEIAGIPQELCDLWSSRRREVLAHMEAHDLTTAKQSDIAALASRRKKERHESLDEVLVRHEAEARRLGYDLERIEALCFGRERERRVEPEVARGEIERKVQELEKHPDFARLPDFERALARDALRLGIGLGEIVAQARGAMTRIGSTLDGLERDLDRRNLTRTLDALAARDGVAAKERGLEHAARKHGLNPNAERALRSLAADGSALRILDGPNTAERHRILDALRDALAQSGVDCVAVTLRSKEVEALREATRIPTFSIAKALREWGLAHEPGFLQNRQETAFRKIRTDAVQDALAWAIGIRTRAEIAWRAWERGRQPLDLADGRHVLVVEEAHNLSPRRLFEVLDEAKRAGATVVLSGDHRVSAGFGHLAATHDAVSLHPAPGIREREKLEDLLRMFRPSEPRLEPEDSVKLGQSR